VTTSVGNPRGRVLLTVSGEIAPDVLEQVARGKRPRPDYCELARALDADVVDVVEARRRAGRFGSLLERLGGVGLLLGWVCFRQRQRYDAIVTDGEQVGLPFAAFCRLLLRIPPTHVMIAHLMSVPKKALLYRALGLGRFVDAMIVYSSAQQRFVVDKLDFPVERTFLTPFMVDTAFFAPNRVTSNGQDRPTVCTAGLEFRDYPTLIEAVRGVDARVVIAAASPWSKRRDATEGVDLPNNVEVCRLGFVDLRQLYSDSTVVVMPLQDVEFQAGITTILEAMAMGKPVLCSETRGQTDVIQDGITGVYVEPGDSHLLQQAICALLSDAETATAIGQAARDYVVRFCDVSVYAERLAGVVHCTARTRLQVSPRTQTNGRPRVDARPPPPRACLDGRTSPMGSAAFRRARGNGSPRVSVVIPAFNREPFIALTIKSVLNQSFDDWELVVYDDGSTDRTFEVARACAVTDSRIRVERGPNRGVAVARNEGLALTDPGSDFVIFLDSDDLWEPDALETLVGVLDAHPEYVAAHCLARCIDSEGRPIPGDDLEEKLRDRHGFRGERLVRVEPSEPTMFSELVYQNWVLTPGTQLLRRDVVTLVGGFDPATEPADDADMAIRVSRHGPTAFVDRPLLHWRRHPQALSNTSARWSAATARLRAKTLTDPDNTAEQRDAVRLAFLHSIKSLLRDARFSLSAKNYSATAKWTVKAMKLLVDYLRLSIGMRLRGAAAQHHV
jgi:glycosyltransferase involved in cell wall biosynthesis/GT2 family glycosyltransferase